MRVQVHAPMLRAAGDRDKDDDRLTAVTFRPFRPREVAAALVGRRAAAVGESPS
jgi:hypothetical protein